MVFTVVSLSQKKKRKKEKRKREKIDNEQQVGVVLVAPSFFSLAVFCEVLLHRLCVIILSDHTCVCFACRMYDSSLKLNSCLILQKFPFHSSFYLFSSVTPAFIFFYYLLSWSVHCTMGGAPSLNISFFISKFLSPLWSVYTTS